MSKFLQLIKRSFTALRMTNESGIIHLIPLFILLIGIIGGVYLVQHPTIFRPKADEQTIQWIVPTGSDSENCITKVDGLTATATCPRVQFKLNPPDLNQSSDAGPNMSLVKTAYAADFISGGRCRDDDKGNIYAPAGYTVGKVAECSEGTECISINGGAACGNDGIPLIEGSGWSCKDTKIHKDGFHPDWLQFLNIGETNINCPNDTKCTDLGNNKFTCSAGGQAGGSSGDSAAQGNKPVNLEPKGDTFVNPKEMFTFNWTSPTGLNISKYRFMMTSSDDTLEYNGNCPSFANHYRDCYQFSYQDVTGLAMVPSNFKDGATYTWWVDALDENGKTLGTSDGTSFTVHKTSATGAGTTGVGTTTPGKTIEIAPPGKPGAAVCPAGSDKNEPYGQCGGTTGLEKEDPSHVFEVTKVTDCHGNPKPFLKQDKGFSDECQKAAVGRGAPSEKTTVPTSAPAGSSARKIVEFRYAFSSSVLLPNAPWQALTADPIKIILPTASPGLHSIFVQFRDDKGQIVKVKGSDYAIGYVQINPPTGSETQAPKTEERPSGTTDCPLSNYSNYDIPTLKQKCSLTELAKLPQSALRTFSNEDLLAIAKSVDGASGPYRFLSKFDNSRLGSFDLDVLKKLTEDRINQLPEALKNVIKGTGSTSSETASCTSISSSVAVSGGTLAATRVRFSGNPTTLKIWIASNSEVGKAASAVSSWTQVSTIPNPTQETYSVDITGFSAGKHAVLMSLHGSYGQMLDGNLERILNSSCATVLDIP